MDKIFPFSAESGATSIPAANLVPCEASLDLHPGLVPLVLLLFSLLLHPIPSTLLFLLLSIVEQLFPCFDQRFCQRDHLKVQLYNTEDFIYVYCHLVVVAAFSEGIHCHTNP